jgi:DNA-binding transcriptional LysR family regulator
MTRAPKKLRLAQSVRIRDLQYILSIDVLGSVRKAAQAHNISQPALSKILSEIEAVLGVKLFDRDARKSVATEFGRLFLSEAAQITASVNLLETRIDEQRRRVRHIYRIGATPNPAYRLVPDAFMRALQTFPKLRLQLSEGETEPLLKDLRNRKYDLVIARSVTNDITGVLHRTLLYEEVGIVVARCHHPLFLQRDVDIEDLQRFPWIFSQPGPTRNAIYHTFLNAGLDPPEGFFINYTISIVSDVLMKSDALAVLPLGVVSPFLRGGLLQRLPVSLNFILPSYALYRNRSDVVDEEMQHLERLFVELSQLL